MEHSTTPEPTPIYWDGESIIVTGRDEDGLPTMLFPSDAQTYKPTAPSYHDNFKAEDLDRKCTNV